MRLAAASPKAAFSRSSSGAALTVGVLSYSDLAGIPVTAGPDFTAGLMAYTLDISVGQAWFWVTVVAAVVRHDPIGRAHV